MIPTVRLMIAPSDGRVAAGDTLHVAVGLDDAGSGGAYQITVHGLPESWYTLDRPVVTLDPGAHAAVDLAIRPPASHGRRADTCEVVVEVRAEDAPAVLTSATLRLSVGPLDGVGVDVWPAYAAGATAVFGATAFNALEWDAAVELAVAAPTGLEVRVDPPGYAVVPAGGSLLFTIRVAPTDARASGGVYDLAVYGVRPGGDRAVAATKAHRVRFVYRPPLLRGAFARTSPARVALMAGLVLLLLVLGIVAASGATRAKLTGSPAATPVARSAPGSGGAAVRRDAGAVTAASDDGIARFSAAPDPSGGVIVAWSAPYALDVLLNGQRVPRSGRQVLRLTRPATLVLTAIGADGVGTRRLRVVPAPVTVEARRTEHPRQQRAAPAVPSPALNATTEPRATSLARAGTAARHAAPPTHGPIAGATTRPSGASNRRPTATPAARATATPRPDTTRTRRQPSSTSERHTRPHRRTGSAQRRRFRPSPTPTPTAGTAVAMRRVRQTTTPTALPQFTAAPTPLPRPTATPGAQVRATPTARAARATATTRPRRNSDATATPEPAATSTRIAVRTRVRPTATPTPARRSPRGARATATPTRARSTHPLVTPTAVTSGRRVTSGVPTSTPTSTPTPTARTARPGVVPSPTVTALAPQPSPTSAATAAPETQPSPTSAAAPTPTGTPQAAGGGPTAAPTPSPEPAPSVTPQAVVPVPSATPTATPTPTATATPAPSPSATATETITPTATDTPTATPTATGTPADTPTATPVPTPTPRHHRRHE